MGFVWFIIGFIVSTIACIWYGQYAMRGLIRDKSIQSTKMSTLNGDKWSAYIKGNLSYEEIADSEEAAVGKLYIRIIKDAKKKLNIE